MRAKAVDVVLVGFGWAGAILAREFADTGLKVVALERGPDRRIDPDFQPGVMHDELRYAIHHELMQDLSRETVTFRNKRDQTALPMRRGGSFLPGNGVGGSGASWGGQQWRLAPSDFEIGSHYSGRYGAKFIPQDMSIQDWGIAYKDLEPFYDRFEYLCGTAGQAGNIGGKTVPGGNPFEGVRRRGYPTPPLKSAWAMILFEEASRKLGYHPFPQPAAILSQAYTNSEGVPMLPCLYCGYCERYGCETHAKASPQTTLLPVIQKDANFELRANAIVTGIELDNQRKRATGVTYLDAFGHEVEQPADLVLLCASSLANVHLLLLSGIGKPYDPDSGQGVVGRNYSYRLASRLTLFFENQTFNPFMGAGALAMCIDDINADNFDHGPLGFVGGASVACTSKGGLPIGFHPVPDGTPRWGSGWKKAVAKFYGHACTIVADAGGMAYRGNYLDLDPTYKDFYGRPLLRMTYDHQENDLKALRHAADVCAKIGKAMGAGQLSTETAAAPFPIAVLDSMNAAGGAAMGASPATSAVNRYLQCWDVPNVFVMGKAVFPQHGSYHPVGTEGALAYWAADAIKTRYLKSPGPLVPV